MDRNHRAKIEWPAPALLDRAAINKHDSMTCYYDVHRARLSSGWPSVVNTALSWPMIYSDIFVEVAYFNYTCMYLTPPL